MNWYKNGRIWSIITKKKIINPPKIIKIKKNKMKLSVLLRKQRRAVYLPKEVSQKLVLKKMTDIKERLKVITTGVLVNF